MLLSGKVYSGNFVEFPTRWPFSANLVHNTTNHTQTRCSQLKK
jgi:hypothetical protein